MQSFRTAIPKQDFSFSIDHQDQILSMGSCFAQNMGLRLKNLKFPIIANPFGILYHPVVIAQNLDRLSHKMAYQNTDLIENQQRWHSFDHHSSYSSDSPEQTLKNINGDLQKAATTLQETKVLLLTFGTAYAWRHLASNKLVANCHKLPAAHFEKILVPREAIIEKLQSTLLRLKDQSPDLQCLLTVSPVRHLRDGLLNNQISKAILRLSAHYLTKELDFVHYFPSYEIMMDDLRDYRFYERDLLHPSPMALDYIWEHFQESMMTTATQASCQQIAKIKKALAHRPFNPKTDAHQTFLTKTLAEIEKIEQKYPSVSFEQERCEIVPS